MLEPLSEKPTHDSPEATRARIATWLLGEGWQLAEKQHEGALWLLEASDSQGRHLVVGQRAGRPEQIIFEGAVALSEPHQRQFAALPPARRQEILWELRFTLLSLGVDFHGAQEPLTRVAVGQRIYEDGLTRDRFTQRMMQVRNAILAVLWTVARHLEPSPASTEYGETHIH